MKPEVYVVTAHRWGHRDGHTYTVGVFSKKHAALKAAEVEEEYRGGKYSCEVYEWTMDEGVQGNRTAKPKLIRERTPHVQVTETLTGGKENG